jgi:hypothetical protein
MGTVGFDTSRNVPKEPLAAAMSRSGLFNVDRLRNSICAMFVPWPACRAGIGILPLGDRPREPRHPARRAALLGRAAVARSCFEVGVITHLIAQAM